MNCYIHIDKPTVAACPECGMGLCRDCVDNAIYTQGSRPLCHDCSLKQATTDLADAKSKKIWSLVKFVFGASFLLLGISIYSSTGDVMNAWIYAGIAGIPSAFRSTRDSKREKVRKGVRDALTTDVVDTSFNFFTDLLVRLLLILFLAPITAAFSAIKNLFVFIGSFSKVKHAQEVYDYLSSEEDIAGHDNASQQQTEVFVPAPQEQENVELQPCETTDAAQPSQTAIPVPSAPQAPQSVQSSVPAPDTHAMPAPKKNTGLIVGSIAGVLLVAVGIAAYILWYVPYARDRDALRTYVVATNVFLRSSEMAGVEYNIVDKIPYGSELITYSKGTEWAHVKINGQEGYMASSYLIGQPDFYLLNSAWGDADSRECIESSKCRMAILDFYKRNNFTGGSNGWQIYTKAKDMKPNSVAYPRLYNKSSKFTDFLFVAKNNINGQRILAGYSFDDETEKPIFRFMTQAPAEGYIQKASVRYNNIVIQFDNNRTVTLPFQH